MRHLYYVNITIKRFAFRFIQCEGLQLTVILFAYNYSYKRFSKKKHYLEKIGVRSALKGGVYEKYLITSGMLNETSWRWEGQMYIEPKRDDLLGNID